MYAYCILITICCRDCDYHYSGVGLKSAYPGRSHRDSPGRDRGVCGYICVCGYAFMFTYVDMYTYMHMYTLKLIHLYM